MGQHAHQVKEVKPISFKKKLVVSFFLMTRVSNHHLKVSHLHDTLESLSKLSLELHQSKYEHGSRGNMKECVVKDCKKEEEK